MNTKKKVYEFFLKPPLWFDTVIWAVSVCSVGASIFLLFTSYRNRTWAYAVYLAAIVFIVVSIYLGLTFGSMPERFASSPRVKKFFLNFDFRTYVLAVCSAAFNGLYAVFGTLIAVFTRSVWLGALVWYHTVLALTRGLTVLWVKKHSDERDDGEYKYRAYMGCGVALIVLSFAVVPIVWLIVMQRNSYMFIGGALVYSIALALYTVIKLAVQLYNRRRALKYDDPSLSAVRNIGVADALISVLTLQAVMFTVFEDVSLAAVLDPITGGAVALAIFALGLFMVINGRRKHRSNTLDSAQ